MGDNRDTMRRRWTRRHTKRLAMLATLLPAIAGACAESATGRRITWAVVVYGSVTDASGIPLPDVSLEFEVYQPTCADGVRIGGGGPAFTNAAGRYRAQVMSHDSVASQCVRVFIRHCRSSGELVGEASGFQVKRVSETSLPYDSVRVDVTIP